MQAGRSNIVDGRMERGQKHHNDGMWMAVILSSASFGTIGALIGERRGAKGSGAVCGMLLGPIGLLLLVLDTDLLPSGSREREAAAAPKAQSLGQSPRFTSGADLRAIRKAARGHVETHQTPGDGTTHA